MDWNNLGQNIWSLVTAIGGVSVIVVGLSVWIGNILANRFNEKFRLDSEQQIKLLESRHAKEMSELQFEQNKKLEEQKQRLQYEFDLQRQTRQIEAAQNMRFLEKQFDLYLILWDNLQELKFAGEKLWEEANLENMVVFTEAFQKTRLIADKVTLVMDRGNHQMLSDMLMNFERFEVGKRRLVDLKTGNSVRLAYKEYGDVQQIEHRIRNQIDYNGFHRHNYQVLMENIRMELQRRLAGSPFAENFEEIARRTNR
jgi:hypothetical protein